MAKKDPRLERAGVEGFNKPKRTPNHPTKSHVVVAKEGDKITVRRVEGKGRWRPPITLEGPAEPRSRLKIPDKGHRWG